VALNPTSPVTILAALEWQRYRLAASQSISMDGACSYVSGGSVPIAEAEREIFAVYWGRASDEERQQRFPEWLQTLCSDGDFDRLISEFGLPDEARRELIGLVYALELCHAARIEPPFTKKEKGRLLAQVRQLEASIAKYGTRAPPNLRVELFNERSTPDGGVTFEVAPGIWQRGQTMLAELAAGIESIPTHSGRRRGFLHHAVDALMHVIDQYAPDMPPPKRIALAEDLFFEVRRRLGEKSGAAFADEDEVPRLGDLVRRILRQRRARSR